MWGWHGKKVKHWKKENRGGVVSADENKAAFHFMS